MDVFALASIGLSIKAFFSEKTLILEFEAVYCMATVYVNGKAVYDTFSSSNSKGSHT